MLRINLNYLNLSEKVYKYKNSWIFQDDYCKAEDNDNKEQAS